MSVRCIAFFAISYLCLSFALSGSASPAVQLERVPEGGIQPQTAVDQSGTVHLVYYKGDPAAGDLFYATSRDGRTFTEPVRVNSTPGSAVALGNIRGARIALGRRGAVYVVWNGSQKAGRDLPSNHLPGHDSPGHVPMLFARLNGRRDAFEPQRNLIAAAYGIDGGGAVAADGTGRVYVFWHAPVAGAKGEANRRIWMARSDDDGATFEPERIVGNNPIVGACGCCSLDAFADGRGKLYVLFRSARENVHRDMYLLESPDRGAHFQAAEVSRWNVGYCVMSSESFAAGPHSTFAAWETEKRVHFGSIESGAVAISDTAVPSGGNNQKYPSLALGAKGTLLVAWTENMAWKHGGSVHWQLYDRSGSHSVGPAGSAEGVPAWSLVSAFPRRDGSFAILY